ncbi:MAG TPA: MoxR family ATPase [Plasticicumulans sp.]|nr:MoxR family ATPase [Plasticicumulans sp.]
MNESLADACALIQSPFITLASGAVSRLPETPEQAEAWHQWSAAEIDALTLAYAARRPLLVRGEPGTGKTQLARAAAVHLGWKLHVETIQPRFEPGDLVARFDAVRRLADAQAGPCELDDRRYWRPGVLWLAFGWRSAQDFLPVGEREVKAKAEKGERDENDEQDEKGEKHEKDERGEPRGHVVLIDEIDKADSDLPNSLLEVLAQRSFRVPPLAEPVGGPRVQAPLIVITTNEERELPAAFLRRCIVLTLQADPRLSYRDWLLARGRAHFARLPDGAREELLADDMLALAADQLVRDRAAVSAAGLPPPGLAEYLDLLYAVRELLPDDSGAQRAWLQRLSTYAYLKHAAGDGLPVDASQARAPLPAATADASAAQPATGETATAQPAA